MKVMCAFFIWVFFFGTVKEKHEKQTKEKNNEVTSNKSHKMKPILME